MKKELRLRFLHWLMDVSKVPKGAIAPGWIMKIRSILYPLTSFYERQTKLRYCIYSDSYFIEGERFTRAFFKFFNADEKIVKIKRGEYGEILIEELKDVDNQKKI